MTREKRYFGIYFFGAFFLLCALSSCSPKVYSPRFQSQHINQELEYDKSKTKLIGLSNREGLQKAPYSEWFDKNYAAYKPQQDFYKKVKNKTKGVDVKIFMGTWCGDSKMEVPRFYKLMDNISFDKNQIQLVNLDNASERYKQSPEGFEKGMNIHRVPTFIFYKDGAEIGRIVEHPATDLETDIAQILNHLAPATRYPGVASLEEILEEKGADYVYENALKIARKIRLQVRNNRALNTYGYVEMAAKKQEKAVAIFKINSLLFSKESNVHDSLGEAYMAVGKNDLALKSYQKVLEISPDDKNAKEMIQKLEG